MEPKHQLQLNKLLTDNAKKCIERMETSSQYPLISVDFANNLQKINSKAEKKMASFPILRMRFITLSRKSATEETSDSLATNICPEIPTKIKGKENMLSEMEVFDIILASVGEDNFLRLFPDFQLYCEQTENVFSKKLNMRILEEEIIILVKWKLFGDTSPVLPIAWPPRSAPPPRR